MAEIDWGTVGQALGALALIKGAKAGVGAYGRDKQIDTYANTINQGLPAQYQIAVPKRHFLFGDTASYQKGLDTLAKQRQDQWQSDYYANNYNVPTGGPAGAMQNVFERISVPNAINQNKYQTDGEYGRKMLQSAPYVQQFLTKAAQQPGAVDAPVTANMPAPTDIGNGVMWDNGMNQSQQPSVLSAGAQENVLPELPEWLYVTPEMIKNFLADNTKNRNLDQLEPVRESTRTRNVAQTKKTEEEIKTIAPKAQENLVLTKLRQKQIQQNLAWGDKLAQARIASLNRSNQGSGRNGGRGGGRGSAGTSLMQNYQYLRNQMQKGDLTGSEFKAATSKLLYGDPYGSFNEDEETESTGVSTPKSTPRTVSKATAPASNFSASKVGSSYASKSFQDRIRRNSGSVGKYGVQY